MEITCRDCRTSPKMSGPELGLVTHIWCPECEAELQGEEANRRTVDEIRYMEGRRQTALWPPPSVMNRGPFVFGWPGQSALYQAARLGAIRIGLNFEARRTQEPRRRDLLLTIASSYDTAAHAVDPVSKRGG